MAITVLVVEDQKKLSDMIADYLTALEYRVIQAQDGIRAKTAIAENNIDIAVIDVVIPGIDGFDLLKSLRQSSDGRESLPVIMLTARAEENDRLMGLELGADDYMTKPFSLKELEARIRAVLRRTRRGTNESPQGAALNVRDLHMDTAKRSVQRNGAAVDLTSVQYDLLRTFMQKPGRVFTRIELLETFQDMGFEGYERTIDVHIKNIRKALEPDPANPSYIKTVWGVGYKLEEQE